MALTQRLLKDTTTLPFVLGYVNSHLTTAGDVGNIASETGATSYLDWATSTGMASSDIGGGTQSNTSMAGYVLDTSAGTPNNPFQTYNNTTLVAATALLQQPISYVGGMDPNDVVWGIYFPQNDTGPASTIGKILAYSTTVNAPTSVSTNDPDDTTAKAALTNLLARIGSLYSGTWAGPNFTGTATQDLFGAGGAIAMGAFISYSNTNGTWLVYAG